MTFSFLQPMEDTIGNRNSIHKYSSVFIYVMNRMEVQNKTDFATIFSGNFLFQQYLNISECPSLFLKVISEQKAA